MDDIHMTFWKGRIDTTDIEAVRVLLNELTHVYVFGAEDQDTENPHVHFFMHSTEKEQRLRYQIRKRFGAGQGAYMLHRLDEPFPIELIAYTIKQGKYEVRNISDEIIQESLLFDMEKKRLSKRLNKVVGRYWKKLVASITIAGLSYVLNKTLDFAAYACALI